METFTEEPGRASVLAAHRPGAFSGGAGNGFWRAPFRVA